MPNLLERMKDPVSRQVGHGVAFEPLSAKLLQAGQEIKRKKLKL